MRNLFIVALISIIGFSACTTPFKRAKDGTEYKVISNKDGKKITNGNFIEMNIVAKYGDSVLFNSLEEGMPTFAPYDTAQFPPMFKEVFGNIRVGDSVVIRMSTDSMLAKGEQLPPYMSKGKFLLQTYKIVNAYATKEQADSAQKLHVPVAKERALKKALTAIEKTLADNKAQVAKDSKIIDDYLAKNNIKATKTTWGTYIAVQTPGAGDITRNDVVTVNYTGKTLDSSKVFDSNVDPKFGHVQPYKVNVGQVQSGMPGGVMAGWSDALLQLKKGSKATIYVPSTLAYGKNGRPGINPDQILVFDIEVVDVENEEMAIKKAQEEQAAMQQKMMEAQQRAADSTSKSLKK